MQDFFESMSIVVIYMKVVRSFVRAARVCMRKLGLRLIRVGKVGRVTISVVRKGS